MARYKYESAPLNDADTPTEEPEMIEVPEPKAAKVEIPLFLKDLPLSAARKEALWKALMASGYGDPVHTVSILGSSLTVSLRGFVRGAIDATNDEAYAVLIAYQKAYYNAMGSKAVH